MKPIFSKEELDIIINNYKYKTYKEITGLINEIAVIKKNEKQVRTKASQLGLSKSKYNYNKNYFEVIDTPEKAYWLGFIYADGYIVKNTKNRNYELGISLSIIDYDHLVEFNKCINGNFKIYKFTKEECEYNALKFKERDLCRIRIYSKKFVDDLIRHNIYPDKTHKKEYPIVVDELFSHFLRGFLDGDGCIYKNKKNKVYISFTNSNEMFLTYIKNWLSVNLNLKGGLYCENENKYKLVYFNNYDINMLLNFLYCNASIYLKRKYNIYLCNCLNTAV